MPLRRVRNTTGVCRDASGTLSTRRRQAHLHAMPDPLLREIDEGSDERGHAVFGAEDADQAPCDGDTAPGGWPQEDAQLEKKRMRKPPLTEAAAPCNPSDDRQRNDRSQCRLAAVRWSCTLSLPGHTWDGTCNPSADQSGSGPPLRCLSSPS